jgi:hypothetical protein
MIEVVKHLIKLHNYLDSEQICEAGKDFINSELHQIKSDLVNAKQPSGKTTECSDSVYFVNSIVPQNGMGVQA